MNKYQEAFDKLKSLYEQYVFSVDISVDISENFDIIQELVDKQNPLPPDEYTYANGYTGYVCPKCGESIEYLDADGHPIRTPSCLDCQQVINWWG